VEKFYYAEEWMTYLIDMFLKPGAVLGSELSNPVPGRHYPEEFRHFTFDHDLNGAFDAQGDYDDDRWRLIVTANTVKFYRGGLVLRTRSAAAAAQ
jgi:hypothetical protein